MSDTKISVEDFKAAVAAANSDVPEVETVVWCGFEFEVKRYLTLYEMMEFAENVASTCFVQDTEEYIPEIWEFAMLYSMVKFYTNLELPDDVGEQYELLSRASGLSSAIYTHINESQYEALIEAINRKIQYRARKEIESTTMAINKTIAKLEGLEESVSKLFEGVDGDMIQQVASAVADGKFDEQKLVSAVVAQRDNPEE